MSWGMIQTDTLSGIADAIREKGGTSNTFLPGEMAAAIQGMETQESEDGVYFADHDGTVLCSCTWSEAAGLESLPDLPTWENDIGMTCTGWNWSLEEIQAHEAAGVLYVGAIYEPTDGGSHLFVLITPGSSVILQLQGSTDSSAITVDWGDGSTSEFSGTDLQALSHEYSNEADTEYEIIITASSGSFTFYGDYYNGALYQAPSYGLTSNYFRRYQLTRLYVGPSCAGILDYAFSCCHALEEVTVHGDLDTISEYAFYECTNLGVIILNSVTALETYTFCNCYSLKAVYLPDGITSFSGNAFYNCYLLQKVTIPTTLTSLGAYCFYACGSLSSVVLPEGLTEIGKYAFYNCVCLEEVGLPSTLTSIGADAFYGCRKLSSIVIPEGVTAIASYTFDYCSALESAELPETLTSIGDYAFANCPRLTSVDIPEGTETLGSNAFAGSYALTTVTLPSTLTGIGSYAFNFDYNLESIDLPEGLQTIGTYAFYYCYVLAEVGIPTTLLSVGARAFYNCRLLQELDLSATGVTSIGTYGFCYCCNLRTVYLPDTLTSLGTYAFADCYNLWKVDGLYKQSGVSTVTEFGSCSQLTTLTNVREVNSSISFSGSPLTYESVINLFNGLSSDNTGTVTLSSESYALLSDDDIAIATDKGWTVASA